MAENVLKSQARYRMSQIVWVRRDLALQDSDLRRKNQIIQHLSVAFCILLQYWYSTAVSSSPCGVYVSRESSTHLIVWPKRDNYFPWHDSSVLIFNSHPFGFCSAPWDLGKDFSPLEKNHPYHRVYIVPGYVLDICTDETESQWQVLTYSEKGSDALYYWGW